MRKIKFRGKIDDNWWYTSPRDDNWEQFWNIVDIDTVCQFTGVCDNSNKEIYEKDIVNIVDSGDYNDLLNDNPKLFGKIGEIFYSTCYFSVAVKGCDFYDLWEFVGHNEGVSLIVIGNIYENETLVCKT